LGGGEGGGVGGAVGVEGDGGVAEGVDCYVGEGRGRGGEAEAEVAEAGVVDAYGLVGVEGSGEGNGGKGLLLLRCWWSCWLERWC
jgi:hypothetical protein